MLELLVGALLSHLALFYVVERVRSWMYRNELSLCAVPMPGPEFPWARCPHGACPWCDRIQAYEAEPEPGIYR
jgi:hypothetical protein